MGLSLKPGKTQGLSSEGRRAEGQCGVQPFGAGRDWEVPQFNPLISAPVL